MNRRPVSVTVHNRQRAIRIDLKLLQRFAESALTECLNVPGRDLDLLAQLTAVDVVLISDRRMTDLHRKFLNDPTPTDVITFQHGEIFISVETATRQARSFGASVDHEIRLYLVHGLLHLHGYDDKTNPGAAEMKRLQEKIVAVAL